MTPELDKRRRYHAPARQAQAEATRGRILSAAYDLFARQGFSATIAQIADRAGVSRATVELLFGTKAGLLGAVVDVALAGDDEPVPILDRPWVADLLTLTAPLLVERAGQAFAAGAARVGPLLSAIDEGASRDRRLAELADQRRRQRTIMATWVVDAVNAKGALAKDLTVDVAVDTVLVVLDPAVHRRFLLERGWSADRLGAWIGRSLRLLLLHEADRQR